MIWSVDWHLLLRPGIFSILIAQLLSPLEHLKKVFSIRISNLALTHPEWFPLYLCLSTKLLSWRLTFPTCFGTSYWLLNVSCFSCWFLTADLKLSSMKFLIPWLSYFFRCNIPTNVAQQAAFRGNFSCIDYPNDSISWVHASTWTGSIHVSKSSNLQQLLTVSQFGQSDFKRSYELKSQSVW